MTKNPYNMKRKWTIEVDQMENTTISRTTKQNFTSSYE